MAISISSSDYELFCKYLEHECGIVLGDNKQYLIPNRLGSLCQEIGINSLGEVLDKIKSGVVPKLRARVIDAMTTNETLWFRDQYPFEYLKRIILPEILRGRPAQVRIWSAACSSGQEPYSISMIMEEFRSDYPKSPLHSIQIMATDISSSILNTAKIGAYNELALSRGLSADRRDRFFQEQNGKIMVKESVRKQVTFREINLKDSFTTFGKFHVIFCRNVLIYFSPELKTDILNRMANSLEPGGYLFLGGSESISRYTDKFESVRSFNGMAFRVKNAVRAQAG